MNKISINNPSKVNEIRNSGEKQLESKRASAAKKPAPKAEVGSDRVKLSGRAAEVQKLTARVAKLPDIRSELVSKFQEAIANQEYSPASGDISNALISEEL